MTARPVAEGRTYLRRSDAKQENSIEMQLHWALGEAPKHGIQLEASLDDLPQFPLSGSIVYRHNYLDSDLSGADLDREAFRRLIADCQTNKQVSHVFIHKRDRLGRPDNPVEMMLLEQQFTNAGITLVFSDGIARPTQRGQTNLEHIIQMLFGYVQSGDYLKLLAERVIEAHYNVAKRGYRTGGNPPYGFGRFLVDAEGRIVEELAKGRHVRQSGYHVQIRPNDPAKIAVWVHILELKHQGWGGKRIANHLNEVGIPSPGSGQIRTDHGGPHPVSGLWSPNTVNDLCNNQAILALQAYGRRSEGAHRRLGHDAMPRLLDDSDRTLDGKPRVIRNDSSLVVRAPLGFPAAYDPDKWGEIQRQMRARATTQAGIRRAKDPAKYPLSLRVFDQSDGCGSPMYGVTVSGRPLYRCGDYMKSACSRCNNNQVDAEALLKFVLHTIAESVDRCGGRGKLKELLEARARKSQDGIQNREQDLARRQLESSVATLRANLATAERRMAIEEDEDDARAFRTQVHSLRVELRAAEAKLAEWQRTNSAHETPFDLDNAVSSSLRLFEQLSKAAEDRSARAAVNQLVTSLGLRIGLSFRGQIKGVKREVRVLDGGVIAFGNRQLPVPLFGGAAVSRIPHSIGSQRTLAATLDGRTQEVSCRTSQAIAGQGDSAMEVDIPAPDCHLEGNSSTKVNRGKPTRAELFRDAIRSLDVTNLAILRQAMQASNANHLGDARN